MSDFPLDIELVSPPMSPAPSENTLDALCTLDQFSPDLTPTQLSFTWSSGHIPVMLYDKDYIDNLESQGFAISDFSLASVNPGHVGDSASCTSGLRRSVPRSNSSSTTSRRHVHSAGSRASSSRTDSVYLGLNSLDSSNTISSVGTFGPRGRTRRQSSGSTELPSQRPEVSSFPQIFSSSVSLKDHSIVPNRKRRSTITSQNTSGIFASPSVLSDGSGKWAYSIARRDSSNTISTDSDVDGQSRRTSATGVNLGTESDTSFVIDDSEYDDGNSEPLTPRKAIPKTISWISSRDWDCQQYKEYIAQQNLHGSPCSPSPVNGSSDGNLSPSPRRCRAPAHINVLEHRDLNVIVETPRASQFAREVVQGDPESPVRREMSQPAPYMYSLRHDEHNWLRDVTLQFLVDQEGFRAAHPSLRFTGVARLRPFQNSKSAPIVMGQFRPVTRQTFHFHYAPFESPPILRRVTVNFDETHDYLSKQALLTLKNNGVYVLHGHEMSLSTLEGESSKLYWQFEYLIDDRRVETSGRVMEGEKIMTPLTFSCTPSLLLPSQGRRNSIMHVFKKGVAPKLVAERLQPPGTSAPAKKITTESQVVEADAPIANFFSSKAHAWNLHKRGQSHGIHTNGNQKHATPSFPQVHDQDSQNVVPDPHSTHRRASSGGENHKRKNVPPRFNTLTSSTNKHPGTSLDTPTPSRHILPPQKLAELLDTPGPLEENTHHPPSIRGSTHFAPLTPRPRHASKVRDPSHTR